MIHAFFLTLSRFMAYLGGIMLLALIVMTCLSIFGRSMNGVLHSDMVMQTAPGVAGWLLDRGVGPINGDFELIEAGVAFSIFAFLPLCTLTGGHASVDIFTQSLSPRVNRALRLITEIIFAGVLILIALQLFGGMQSKIRSGQTTLQLEFPVWWAYAMSLTGAVSAALVSLYLALTRIWETVTGRRVLPDDFGAEH